MANTQTWIGILVFYFIMVTIFISLLAQGEVLTDDIDINTNDAINTEATWIYQATDYLVPGVPVCTANGSLNFEEPDTMLFTFDADDITLSNECTTYCRNETSWFIDAISCPGLCGNYTDSEGVNHIGCAPEDDRWNFLTTVVKFFTFGIDLGLGSYDYIITLIFVWFPLFMLGIMIYMALRGI